MSDTCLRRKDLLELLKISASTLQRRLKSGEIPSGKKISARTMIWDKETVMNWLKNKETSNNT